MSILRLAALAVAVALLFPARPGEGVKLADEARSAGTWLMSSCERNAELCATAGEAVAETGAKALNVATLIGGYARREAEALIAETAQPEPETGAEAPAVAGWRGSAGTGRR